MVFGFFNFEGFKKQTINKSNQTWVKVSDNSVRISVKYIVNIKKIKH